LAEELIDERGLAVVDVGDNCNVTNLFHFFLRVRGGEPEKLAGAGIPYKGFLADLELD
jgi:hypothetical protein